MSLLLSRLAGAGLRVALWAVVALAGLLAVTLLVAGLLAGPRGLNVHDPENLVAGLVCSLIAGLFVATFHLRKETLTLPAKNGPKFLADARAILEELGYEVVRETPVSLATRPGFQALLLGNGIHVDLDAGDAKVTGPKVCVELLRQRLRLRAQLGHLQQSHRGPVRNGELLLRRVEMRLRVLPEQLEAIRRHVIEVLGAEADVTCDLHLAAQNERGLSDSVVEQELRPWLEKQGIGLVIHKEPARLLELPREEERVAQLAS